MTDSPKPAQPFTDGSHECFCDLHYTDHDKTFTCGDCPRDYISGAWKARHEWLNKEADKPKA